MVIGPSSFSANFKKADDDLGEIVPSATTLFLQFFKPSHTSMSLNSISALLIA
jgi:hypothetical protein